MVMKLVLVDCFIYRGPLRVQGRHAAARSDRDEPLTTRMKCAQFRIAYGAVQPQIGQDELLRLPVPRLKAEVRRALVRGFLLRSVLRAHARRLVNEAKADVEALIEGTLDMQAILAGTLKPPTADDIPELAEDDA